MYRSMQNFAVCLSVQRPVKSADRTSVKMRKVCEMRFILLGVGPLLAGRRNDLSWRDRVGLSTISNRGWCDTQTASVSSVYEYIFYSVTNDEFFNVHLGIRHTDVQCGLLPLFLSFF